MKLNDIITEMTSSGSIAIGAVAPMGKVIKRQPDASVYSKPKKKKKTTEAHGNSKVYDKCWDGYKKVPGKKRGEKGSCVKESVTTESWDEDTHKIILAISGSGAPDALVQKAIQAVLRMNESAEETYECDDAFFEAYGIFEETLEEAEYQGRKVQLNKPMQGDVAKFKVYVKDPKTGNVKKVNFGEKGAKIKKNNPERRKSFRARHNCDNPGPKTKARYWSCRAW